MTDTPRWLLAPILLASAVFLGPQAVLAQAPERSGKEVVEAVCAGCHASGAKGAPKIGDKKAWSKRASQGLTSLTQNALKGIRGMPAHGGSPNLTDLEIGRAVAYMVNQSGGKWTEPASAKDMTAERSGAAIVKTQCAKCHEKGVGGAPKIGDRAAWAPRLKDGLDGAVSSAIRGHGGMPPRGDKADLTDSEIKSAINYMFNPTASSAKPKPKAEPAAASDPSHKSVGGMEIYLGVLPAESLRTRHGGTDAEKKMYGGVPSGDGLFPRQRHAARQRHQGRDQGCADRGEGREPDVGRNPEARDRDVQQRGELRQLFPHARQGSLHGHAADPQAGRGGAARGQVRRQAVTRNDAALRRAQVSAQCISPICAAEVS